MPAVIYNGVRVGMIDQRIGHKSRLYKGERRTHKVARVAKKQGAGFWKTFVFYSKITFIVWYIGMFLFPYVLRAQSVSELPAKVETKEMPVEVRTEPIPRERPLTIEEKIKNVFGKDGDVAVAVFKAESGLDPNVIGDLKTKYPSVGIAQIRMLPERGLKVADMLDEDKNIAYAKMLFDKSGFSPWTKFNNGDFKKYLTN